MVALRCAGLQDGLPTLKSQVKNSLRAIQEQGLNLELFLEALFWGNPGCMANPVIWHECTTFM